MKRPRDKQATERTLTLCLALGLAGCMIGPSDGDDVNGNLPIDFSGYGDEPSEPVALQWRETNGGWRTFASATASTGSVQWFAADGGGLRRWYDWSVSATVPAAAWRPTETGARAYVRAADPRDNTPFFSFTRDPFWGSGPNAPGCFPFSDRDAPITTMSDCTDITGITLIEMECGADTERPCPFGCNTRHEAVSGRCSGIDLYTPEASEEHLIATASAMAQLANAAYRDGEITGRIAGFEQDSWYEGGANGVYAHLFVDDEAIVLAIRGTDTGEGLETLRDWLTNLTALPTPVQTHLGFQISATNVFAQTNDRIDELLTDGSGRSLWVTGHSLGGAIAPITARQLDTTGRDVAGVFRFGAPGVGTATWASAYNLGLGDQTHNFAAVDDVVPCTPSPESGWQQPGRVHRVAESGEIDFDAGAACETRFDRFLPVLAPHTVLIDDCPSTRRGRLFAGFFAPHLLLNCVSPTIPTPEEIYTLGSDLLLITRDGHSLVTGYIPRLRSQASPRAVISSGI